VKNWQKHKTPTLVVHGGRDFRVVETEGLSTFNALQRLGIRRSSCTSPTRTTGC